LFYLSITMTNSKNFASFSNANLRLLSQDSSGSKKGATRIAPFFISLAPLPVLTSKG